ncbi:MAG: succinate dehydrogenase/fumarate reductase iron-sulfur subunit [Ignavibacteriaceae bacterium]|jgi:succinate dehydrogenase and fumarate reductase iron-sulfur protein|nr:MAG: succinate dehydrogenase/fumarate reductase iron-sulfur subunit [Chlorobiota bacterium]KXK05854.1 MAG: Succinate dehydrogenase iron-sulfur subunit [Chlorobi bacterium OLB4]MBV6398318.1 Fumarate reductase iron-sulfur subunit [Ignavibacteria bacterium]MCE7952657.1 succinate dehydrogenase/fumarate reductase iron-sulfur subunit [Chlorobi bacterium CHB7]MDL1886769.1 succinate dehydrogenase/fumarate reductase iron-sulfur subunit [Ignavibacteria bacterium CHB1]MEB2329563.1 succinate dehydrogen
MSNGKKMNLSLKIWRQADKNSAGEFKDYTVNNVSPDMSFLEMLDVLNEELIIKGEEPVAFDHDCREGICGSCSLYINGRPHGPKRGVTACQLHMRSFHDGQSIVIEPWRANAFPVVKDLIVDRSAFDRIITAGGFVSVNSGGAADANSILISKDDVEYALDASQCIGCGACVAVCKNSSASLFVGAKIAHLSRLPQGSPERHKRAINMIKQMDKEGFGSCTNTEACAAECPKEISMDVIVTMRKEYMKAIKEME